jgi:hypothetical protein
MTPETFQYVGRYRVQSERVGRPSLLGGTWCEGDASLAQTVNDVLGAHPLRSSGRSVVLRTAMVTHRAGTFADHPDVLYKHDLFAPDRDTPPMRSHVVDLPKASARWEGVLGTIDDIWGPRGREMAAEIPAPAETIRREYFAHEGGHLIGVDVDEKTSSGHFRPGGRLAWPLVYAEEVRADLHALALAADAYAPEEAAAVFLYHVMMRFGFHRAQRTSGASPFGLVPYCLFVVLRELDALDIARTGTGERFAMKATRVADLVSTMRACGTWATEQLTRAELQADSPVERSIVAAAWMRRCIDAEESRAAFARVTK